jgi:hypothetical protein
MTVGASGLPAVTPAQQASRATPASSNWYSAEKGRSRVDCASAARVASSTTARVSAAARPRASSRSVPSRRSLMTRLVSSVTAQNRPCTSPPSPSSGLYEKVW